MSDTVVAIVGMVVCGVVAIVAIRFRWPVKVGVPKVIEIDVGGTETRAKLGAAGHRKAP